MVFKFLLLLISAFLLLQFSHGKALPSSNESVNSTTTATIQSNSSEQLNERDKLLRFVFIELANIADNTLQTVQKLLKDVVAEASAREDKSVGISERIEEYSKFIEKLEALKQNHGKLSRKEEKIQKYSAMYEMSALVRKSDLEALENPSTDDHFFSDLLKKHGLEASKKEFANNFMEFLEKFELKADYYWNSLSNEEQKKSEKFEKWFMDHKAESNEDKKIQSFALFYKNLK